jgi:hypothetical protein
MYGMWQWRYPSIVLGETYNGDDDGGLRQAMQDFDPLFEKEQVREFVPLEQRSWGAPPGRFSGFMPGVEGEHHNSDAKPLAPGAMPKLRSEAYNYQPFSDREYSDFDRPGTTFSGSGSSADIPLIYGLYSGLRGNVRRVAGFPPVVVR